MNLVGSAVTSTERPQQAGPEEEHALTSLPTELSDSAQGRRVWRIGCGDIINRERCLTVLVEENKVVLVGPPGETAVLNPGQLGHLRAALREAAEQAER